MSMSKDALECMATILRENEYEVTLKKSNKKPYISNRFNKISDLDLTSLYTYTCLFIDDYAFDDIDTRGDYVVGSSSATIGYLDLERDYDADDVVIKTNRAYKDSDFITEELKKYDYVIKLKDVIKLMVSNEEFND
jgi:hypothetical protein